MILVNKGREMEERRMFTWHWSFEFMREKVGEGRRRGGGEEEEEVEKGIMKQ